MELRKKLSVNIEGIVKNQFFCEMNAILLDLLVVISILGLF